MLDNVGYTEQAGEKPLVDDPNDAPPPAVPRRARRRADDDAAARREDDPGHRVRQHDHVHARRPRRARARRRHLDRVARGGARQCDRAVHPPPARRADHDRSREPRAAVERPAQSLDHQGRSWSSTATPRCRSRSTRRRARPPARPSRSAARRFSTLEIKITDVSDPPAQAVRRRRRGGLRRDPPARRCMPTTTCASTRSCRCRRTCSTRSAPQAAAHPLMLVMTRDALRPVPPAHRSRAVDRAHVRPARAAHVRAHRQREREPERVRRRDRHRARRSRRRSPPSASESLTGCLQCRAASAADGNPATAWNTPFVDGRRAVGAVRDARSRSRSRT